MRAVLTAARIAAGVVATARLARAARRRPPVGAAPDRAPDVATDEPRTVSVVVPARDEADRIGPLLDLVRGAPGVTEVIVVDDESTDATADVARAAGAAVLAGRPLPAGWAGKAWALHQGIAAASGEWVVTLDADTRPDPRLPAAVVARADADGADLVTVGGRFQCPTAGTRWLHAAMLTTLVYRFGPPGTSGPDDRLMANGQCMALRRGPFCEAGGMSTVRSALVEDVALARVVAGRGSRVAFLDATDLLTVRMFESLGDTLRGWGRSLALPGVEPKPRQLADLAVVVLAQVLPLPRLVLGRGDLLDVVLVALRLGTLAGTRRAYDHADAAYWASPLADSLAALALAAGILRRRHTWRGRTYL